MAHAQSRHTAGALFSREGAFWRLRTLLSALQNLLYACAGLAPSRKLEGCVRRGGFQGLWACQSLPELLP